MEQNSTTTLPNDARMVLMEQKIDYLVEQARASARARKITLILTLIFVVGPVILMLFVLPSTISSLTSSYQI